MRRLPIIVAPCIGAMVSQRSSADSASEKSEALWQHLSTQVADIERHLDGVIGVAILDLKAGKEFLLHADDSCRLARNAGSSVSAKLQLTPLKGYPRGRSDFQVDSTYLVPYLAGANRTRSVGEMIRDDETMGAAGAA